LLLLGRKANAVDNADAEAEEEEEEVGADDLAGDDDDDDDDADDDGGGGVPVLRVRDISSDDAKATEALGVAPPRAAAS
jgi:hypothetical protein